MEIQEVIHRLDMEIDERLYQLTHKELLSLLTTLAQYKGKKDLAKLISDNNHFSVEDLIKALEKKERTLLFQIINEPKNEKDMRTPLRNWLKKSEYRVGFEIPLPGAGRKRFIDVVGFKKGRIMGGKITAIELKSKASRAAIDSAFSQAKDYLRCSDYAYVAVSPYLFLKYPEVLTRKVEDYEGYIGLLLVDRFRVITVFQEAEETDHDDNLYDKVKASFK